VYSCNRDRQNRNDELPSLFDLMRARFELNEASQSLTPPSSWKAQARRGLKRTLRRTAKSIGLVAGARLPLPRRNRAAGAARL
jgi:hypothetical protein